MEANQSKKIGMGAVLAIPDFRKLWIGQAVSQIGDGLTSLATLIVVSQLTQSTTALAGITIAIALPQLIFGLLAGVFVDRWDRKKIMIISDIIRGVLVMGLLLVRRPEDVWIFYVLGFLQAAVGTLFDPAKGAMIPHLMEKDMLLAANSLSQTTRVLTGVLGTALAGILVAATGNTGTVAFLLDSLTFFVSAFFIARIMTRVSGNTKHEKVEIKSIMGELSQGVKYIFSRSMLLAVMVVLSVTMLGIGAVNVLFVPFLTNILSTPTEALGMIEAAQVLGMILGSILIGNFAAKISPRILIPAGVLLLGIFIGLSGAIPSLGWFYPIIFMVGFSIAPVNAATSTLMQKLVPDELRGRVGGAMNTVITLASLISMASAGILGDQIGIRMVFYISGGITIIAGLLAVFLMQEKQSLPIAEKIMETAE